AQRSRERSAPFQAVSGAKSKRSACKRREKLNETRRNRSAHGVVRRFRNHPGGSGAVAQRKPDAAQRIRSARSVTNSVRKVARKRRKETGVKESRANLRCAVGRHTLLHFEEVL